MLARKWPLPSYFSEVNWLDDLWDSFNTGNEIIKAYYYGRRVPADVRNMRTGQRTGLLTKYSVPSKQRKWNAYHVFWSQNAFPKAVKMQLGNDTNQNYFEVQKGTKCYLKWEIHSYTTRPNFCSTSRNRKRNLPSGTMHYLWFTVDAVLQCSSSHCSDDTQRLTWFSSLDWPHRPLSNECQKQMNKFQRS